ncbi:MAG: T9SS type A sorting domain-containing protein [Sphingobacteriales bacterium]|nr:MAG: T9SS type A sorting domain-containing protein [Sphingobacteriales bacterium]
MKKFYIFVMAIVCFAATTTKVQAQCNGVKGPNLLGAKGTFSTPAITVNTSAAACTQNGTATYSPANNVGNALTGCTTGTGSMVPCSDYTYTSANNGLGPEGRYSILKNIGDGNGGNCIKSDWRGWDHTGDGGYFMAVNGAPNTQTSPVFYRIKTIPVCIGATYEFSAWVINLLPGSGPAGSEPNISFRVNGSVIGTSGPIAYQATPTWVRVAGSFVATTSTVDLEVVNATAVASGNDLGLDDISIQLCGSNITVGQGYITGTGNTTFCEGANVSVDFTVTDATASNNWYQWQVSTNGGATFTNSGSPAQASFTGTSYSLTRNIGVATASMNGYKYRLVVATSQAGLTNAGCGFFNEYTLLVPSCAPLPVSLTAFNGKYSNGTSTLEWQTSQEVNNKEFQLLRSHDGTKFDVVATVAGAGNSAIVKSYQYQDRISGQGYVYYRLRQVDFDGKMTTSNIVRLSMGNEAKSLEIYPNPFVNNFTASFSAGRTAKATMQLVNMKGQMVYSTSISVVKGFNAVQMNNLPSLQSGLYQVIIFNEDFKFVGRAQKL